MIVSRQDQFASLFADAPSFRCDQFVSALFNPAFQNWNDVTPFPAAMRKTLDDHVVWMSTKKIIVQESRKKDTFKALLEVAGQNQIETVLMLNRRGGWTVCVSSQVGCAMRCGFCATGKMGLTRNLLADEIIDQYRFWIHFLRLRPELPQRVSNIVFMGMGEPLANYENVKETLNALLKHTDIGRTHVTVSTVGVLPRLEQMLNDPEWPHVRLAVSLHSADPKTRKEIVPTSYDDFLPKLSNWAERYLKKFGNRRHHLTFEYVLLRGVNDSIRQSELLAKLVNKIGNVRVNLIPYNFAGVEFRTSSSQSMKDFFLSLENHGVTVTTRRPMGDDIAAACGQLGGSGVRSC